jgi:hypothetical protein
MRFEDVKRIRKAWRRSPPTHWLKAMQLRYEAPGETDDDGRPARKNKWAKERLATSESEIDVLIAAINDAGQNRMITR